MKCSENKKSCFFLLTYNTYDETHHTDIDSDSSSVFIWQQYTGNDSLKYKQRT